MASTAKKGKKPKSKSLSLQEFLSKDNDNIQAGFNLVTAKRPGSDWADDVEPEPEETYTYSSKDQYILPSAPLGPSIDMAKFPTSPPFTAFIGNLPFDAEDADISLFFKDLHVSSIRLLRHPGDNGRLRGFGYVEFDDRQSLLDALGMSENFIKSSKIKIDIAGNQDEHGRPRKDGRNDRNDRSDRPDRTGGNWRLDNREERAEETMSRDRFGSDRDRFSDRFGDKDREGGGGGGGGGRFGSDRSFGGDRFSDRGESGRRERSGFDRGGSSDDRGSYRNFGSDRNQRDSNGYERRDGNQGGGRRDYGSGYRNNDDRQTDRSGNFDRSRNPNFGHQNVESNSNEPRESEGGEAPKERRRLVLQPRSKPLSDAGEPVTTSSIFGGAKPVDTAAREREIEQRLVKERDLALAKANDLRSRDIDRDLPSYDEADSEHNKRGSVGRSPKTSVSVHSGGASSYHSETDEEKSERSLSLSNAPLSPKADEVKPAPPPKENAWAKRAQTVQQPSDKVRNRYDANNRNAAQDERVGSQDENYSRNRSDEHDSRRGRSEEKEDPDSRPRSKDNGKSKELPKFEAPPPPNYASSNKFGQLYSSDED